MDSNIKVAGGLRVVGGIRGEPEKPLPESVTQELVKEGTAEVVVPEEKKPEAEALQSAEVIAAIPGS